MVQKEPKRARGRPRAYDRDTALRAARDRFWSTGYSGTSLDDLGAATGMNRPSLYAAFGDKHALYLETLARYVDAGHAAMERILSSDLPLAESLLGVYDAALALYYPADSAARGCFLIGTAAVEAATDEAVRSLLGSGLRRFDRAFQARFERARAEGELGADADAATLAKLASALLHTLALRSRAGDGKAALRATAKAGVALLVPARRGRR